MRLRKIFKLNGIKEKINLGSNYPCGCFPDKFVYASNVKNLEILYEQYKENVKAK